MRITKRVIDGGINALNKNVFGVILDSKFPDGTAEDFLTRAENSDVYFIVMAFGGQSEKYKALTSKYSKMRVMESNEISALVKLLEELKG